MKIWNINMLSMFNIQNYFPMSLNKNIQNYILQKQWMFDLEDVIIQLFNIKSIPPITNELQKKLLESLPIVPISMDCN